MRAIIGLGLMFVGGLASAQSESQAYLVCGSAACQPNINAVYFVGGAGGVSGINDLTVGGEYFDVSFAVTPDVSPFVLSSNAAASGQPLTGVDAGNAISAFYAALPPPYGGYPITGDPGPAFITAFAPAGALSATYFGATKLWDVAETLVGGGAAVPTQVFGNNGFSASNKTIFSNGNNEVYYTSWTPVTAPEIDVNSLGTGLTLLLGALAVLRGRIPRRSAGQGPSAGAAVVPSAG